MKPTGAGAVMADHAPAVVAADDPRAALFRKLEYFPTAPFAARAIGEVILALDPGRWWCWEPCCGEGHMAYGLGDYFEAVHATDIHDFTAQVGSCAAAGTLQQGPPLDFLAAAADVVDQADWIIFNPPFSLGEAFVEAGLRRARRGVAVLARSGWMDSGGRYPLFFGAPEKGGRRGCDLELPFFDRVPMSLGRWEPKSTEKGGSSATPYSLFVWFKDAARPRWIAQAHAALGAHLPLRSEGAAAPIAGMGRRGVVTIGIPPGTKARLTRPNDAALWGARKAAPLFEGACDA